MKKHVVSIAILSSVLAIGIIVMAFTVPQMANRISDLYVGYGDVYAWVNGTPLQGSPWGPDRESQCGIFYCTHHPLLASYLSVGVGKAGFDPRWAQVAPLALLVALFCFVVSLYSLSSGAMYWTLMVGTIFLCPGFNQWLTLPLENTWAVTCVFLIGVTALLPYSLAIPVATFLTAWFSTDLVFIHAAIIAGFTFASWGFSRKALIVGVASVVAYVLANAMHIAQVLCYFDWNWNMMVGNYFTCAQPGSTCVLNRLSLHSDFYNRMTAGWWVITSYWEEFWSNRNGQWTTAPYLLVWFISGALLPYEGSLKLVIALGFIVAAFAAPGLWEPHLHFFPRYLMLLPVAWVMCQGIKDVRKPGRLA